MKAANVLIACGIFQDEIEFCLKKAIIEPLEIHWLEAGLHCDLAALENELQATVDHLRENQKPRLKLLFGYGCLPDMRALAEKWRVSLLPAKNCLAALAGEKKILELERGRTLVITPAWIRRLWFADPKNKPWASWGPTDLRLNLGRYDRILVLDAGIASLTDEEILEAFDIVQVPLEIKRCALDNFQKLLVDFLSDDQGEGIFQG